MAAVQRLPLPPAAPPQPCRGRWKTNGSFPWTERTTPTRSPCFLSLAATALSVSTISFAEEERGYSLLRRGQDDIHQVARRRLHRRCVRRGQSGEVDMTGRGGGQSGAGGDAASPFLSPRPSKSLESPPPKFSMDAVSIATAAAPAVMNRRPAAAQLGFLHPQLRSRKFPKTATTTQYSSRNNPMVPSTGVMFAKLNADTSEIKLTEKQGDDTEDDKKKVNGSMKIPRVWLSLSDCWEKMKVSIFEFMIDTSGKKEAIYTVYSYIAIGIVLSLNLWREASDSDEKPSGFKAFFITIVCMVGKKLYDSLKTTKEVGELLSFFYQVVCI
uniref:Uncharacterized protein n=1 Tax=Oryza meridionalis TaxID=40149 RepID=A0A0E0CV70_9ORYZ